MSQSAAEAVKVPAHERFRGLALVVLCVGQLVIVLDGAVVNVALPAIQRELHFAGASLAWVVNAYLITFGGLLLLAGRLGDLFGQKRIFLFGLGLFTVASALCGLSDTAAWLVASRFLQGVGAAFASAMVLGILVTTYPGPRERTRAMSIYAFVANVGGAIGLLFGGGITATLGWHWIFYLNVPIGIAGVVLGAILIEDRPGIGIHEGVDVGGALFVVAAPTIAIYGIVGASTAGWLSARTLALLAIAVACGIAFVIREQHAPQPLVPFTIFASRNIRSANLIRFCHGVGMSTFLFVGTLYLQDVLHYSAFAAGVAYLPANIVVGTFSLFVISRLIRRFSAPPLVPVGHFLAAVGFALLALAPIDGLYARSILPGFLIIGVGASMVFMPTVVLSMADARPEESGMASGLANVTIQFGFALGTAMVASVASGVTRSDLRSGVPGPVALLSGYHVGFLIGAGTLFVSSMTALVLLAIPNRHAIPRRDGSARAAIVSDAELAVDAEAP